MNFWMEEYDVLLAVCAGRCLGWATLRIVFVPFVTSRQSQSHNSCFGDCSSPRLILPWSNESVSNATLRYCRQKVYIFWNNGRSADVIIASRGALRCSNISGQKRHTTKYNYACSSVAIRRGALILIETIWRNRAIAELKSISNTIGSECIVTNGAAQASGLGCLSTFSSLLFLV